MFTFSFLFLEDFFTYALIPKTTPQRSALLQTSTMSSFVSLVQWLGLALLFPTFCSALRSLGTDHILRSPFSRSADVLTSLSVEGQTSTGPMGFAATISSSMRQMFFVYFIVLFFLIAACLCIQVKPSTTTTLTPSPPVSQLNAVKSLSPITSDLWVLFS